MKRIVGIVLSVIMILSLASVSFGFTKAPAADTKKNLTISVAYYGSAQGMDQDALGKYVQQKFNFKLKYVSTDNDKLKVMAAAKNLPDVFPLDIMDSFFYNLKKSKLIREVPDKILAKYPLVKKMNDMNACNMTAKQFNGGKMFSIAHPAMADYPTKSYGCVAYMRNDWLKKLNLQAPTTMDELYNVLKAFTFNDPDGNGQNDTYGLSGWLWSVYFAPWVDYYGWVKDNGKWVPGYASDRLKPALQFYNRLYKEKILDPEFAQAPKEKFIQGHVGYMVLNGGTYWLGEILTQFQNATELKYKDAIKILPPLKTDANSKPQWIAGTESFSTLFSSQCTDDKMNRILMFIDWSLSTEGRMFKLYGRKDKDYKIVNGKVVSTIPKDDWGHIPPIYQAFPSVQIFNLACWDVESPIPAQNPATPKEFEDMWKKLEKDVYGPASTTPNFAIDFLPSPAREKYTVGVLDVEAQLQKLIASKGDPIAEFEKYRTKLLKVNGLQKVIDEKNAEAAKKGIK